MLNVSLLMADSWPYRVRRWTAGGSSPPRDLSLGQSQFPPKMFQPVLLRYRLPRWIQMLRFRLQPLMCQTCAFRYHSQKKKTPIALLTRSFQFHPLPRWNLDIVPPSSLTASTASEAMEATTTVYTAAMAPITTLRAPLYLTWATEMSLLSVCATPIVLVSASVAVVVVTSAAVLCPFRFLRTVAEILDGFACNA